MRQIGVDVVPPAVAAQRVLIGGPVQTERGFVLHESAGAWDSSLALDDDLFLTTSKDVLLAISEGRGPRRFLVMLGYAGWIAGQLEQELRENAWLTVAPHDQNLLFETPLEQRWDAAARLLGIDISRMTGAVGHA
jgi:putative transcriptional regulator